MILGHFGGVGGLIVTQFTVGTGELDIFFIVHCFYYLKTISSLTECKSHQMQHEIGGNTRLNEKL